MFVDSEYLETDSEIKRGLYVTTCGQAANLLKWRLRPGIPR